MKNGVIDMAKDIERLLIFDLDGTLFYTQKLNYNAYNVAFNKFGYQITFDEYVNLCEGKSYKQFIPQFIPGCSEQLVDKIHSIKKEVYRDFLHTAKKNDELFDLIINRPADTHIAIATTASKQNCMEILTAFNLVDYFDAIITQDDVTRHKPDVECFEILLSRFGVKKQNTTVYDDTKAVIDAARNFGLNTRMVCCLH